MKANQVYRIAREILLPTLKPKGFSEKRGEYSRVLGTGVAHLIAFDLDPHGSKTFRVICGVDAQQLQNENRPHYGYKKHDGLHHLTPKGWDLNSGRWPCETEEETRASLTMLLPLIIELALPYFAPINTLSDVGNEINDIRKPGLGWMKARLYMLDGDISRARKSIECYAQWAAKPRNWGSKEHQQEDIARAERVRQEIEAAAQGMSG